MGQLTQNIIFFNDLVGNILPNSRHTFFEAGTTTPKAVFSDKELQNPIAQPVISNARGILPQIWLESGSYRWISREDNGSGGDGPLIEDLDDVNFAESIINTTAAIVFSTDANLALGVAVNGETVSLQLGQSVATQGAITAKDGLGRDFIIESTSSPGFVQVPGGDFANPLSNFSSSTEIDSKISDHNVSPTAHADIRTEIDTDISAHNVSPTAHADIRTEIDTDISAHNTDSSAHPNEPKTMSFLLPETPGSSPGSVTKYLSNPTDPTVQVQQSVTGEYLVSFGSNIFNASYSVLPMEDHSIPYIQIVPPVGASNNASIINKDDAGVLTNNRLFVICHYKTS